VDARDAFGAEFGGLALSIPIDRARECDHSIADSDVEAVFGDVGVEFEGSPDLAYDLGIGADGYCSLGSRIQPFRERRGYGRDRRSATGAPLYSDASPCV